MSTQAHPWGFDHLPSIVLVTLFFRAQQFSGCASKVKMLPQQSVAARQPLTALDLLPVGEAVLQLR